MAMCPLWRGNRINVMEFLLAILISIALFWPIFKMWLLMQPTIKEYEEAMKQLSKLVEETPEEEGESP